MTRQRIPEISKIGYIRSDQLPHNVMLQSMAGLVIGVAADITWIQFVGEAELSWEGTTVNGGRQEKSTLKFDTHTVIPDVRDITFVVRCASGLGYLIGTREGRRPVVNYTETTGKRTGNRAARTYTITHVAQKSVIECAL